jgi:hypothetical protein
MHDYYTVFYPAAFLIAATARHHRDAIVLVLHFILFPMGVYKILRDGAELTRTAGAGARRRLRVHLEH